MADYHAKMEELQMQFQQMNSGLSTSTLAADLSWFKRHVFASMESLQRQVEILSREVDRLEMKKRRKILLMHGVPENRTEETTKSVVSIICDRMALNGFSGECIQHSHRLGRRSGKRPRPIVVKFKDVGWRNSVWFAKNALKGSEVTIFEFLTKSRRAVLATARRRFGVTNCWTRDGSIHVIATDGSHHRAESLAELNAIPMLPAFGGGTTAFADIFAAQTKTTRQ